MKRVRFAVKMVEVKATVQHPVLAVRSVFVVTAPLPIRREAAMRSMAHYWYWTVFLLAAVSMTSIPTIFPVLKF